METSFQRLDQYSKGEFSPGASLFWQIGWYFIGSPLVRSHFLPSSAVRAAILRLFGAKVGYGTVLKPGIKIKFPWRLSIGNHSWIGEDAWIDNLACVAIGDHVCISQGAYICTGNHNYRDRTFHLMTSPVTIESHAWIGAKANLAPGAAIREGAIVTLGSTVMGEVKRGEIVQGNPAALIGARAKD